jgi:hypothetical protein
MAFPRSPSLSDTHTIDQSTWRWTGYAWKREPNIGATGATGAQGIQGPTGATGITPNSINEATGVLFGGIISGSLGGTTFNVSAGIGQIAGLTSDITGVESTITEVTWDAFTGVTLPYIGTSLYSFIYIDENGDLQQQPTPFAEDQYRDTIPLGVVCHIDNASISLITNAQRTAYSNTFRLLNLIKVFGPMKRSGLIVSPNGTNLRLNRSSGLVFKLGVNYVDDPFEPDEMSLGASSPTTFCRLYRDGSGDFVYDSNGGAFYTDIDPTQYDDGDGTLASVNNNWWTVQRLFLFPNLPNDILVYYGPAQYNSFSGARSAIDTEVFEESPVTAVNAVFLGYLIVRGGASDLSSTSDAVIIQSGFSRGVGGGGGAGESSVGPAGPTGPTGPTGPAGQDADATALVWMFGA